MQIARTPSYPTLPVAQETPRERLNAEYVTPPVQPSGVVSTRATRAIEDIRSAEQLLDRRTSRSVDAYDTQPGRQQRAVAAYQSLQRSDERAYVSQVLGIDVYA